MAGNDGDWTYRDELDPILDLAELSLKLGTTFRTTEHPGGSLESDTTHSVMLAIVGCQINQDLGLGLDDGLIAKLALVHDLHEAICGDECTLRQDPDRLAAKKEREAAAIEQVKLLPWAGFYVQLYHLQGIREARFVRAVDKLLPELTYILNGARVLKAKGMTKEEFHAAIMVRQYADMETYCGDMPGVLELHRFYGAWVEDLL